MRGRWVMDGRRIQFSVWNLMLMMVPLAVVFWLASQAGSALDWKIWAACLYVGCGPAIGALVGGWRGMKVGLGWIVVGQFFVLAFVACVVDVAYLIQFGAGEGASLQVWSVGLAVLALGEIPLIGVVIRRFKVFLPP